MPTTTPPSDGPTIPRRSPAPARGRRIALTLLALALPVLAVWSLAAGLPESPGTVLELDRGRLVWIAVIAGLPAFVGLLWLADRLHEDSRLYDQAIRGIACASWVLLALTGVFHVNRKFDPGSPSVSWFRVDSKVPLAGDSRGACRLALSEISTGHTLKLDARREECEWLAPGDDVEIPLQAGGLGARWSDGTIGPGR